VGREAVALMNGILCDQNITKESKTQMYNTVLKSIITYSCEEKIKKKIRATEMDSGDAQPGALEDKE
jgi:hypothetical protein